MRYTPSITGMGMRGITLRESHLVYIYTHRWMHKFIVFWYVLALVGSRLEVWGLRFVFVPSVWDTFIVLIGLLPLRNSNSLRIFNRSVSKRKLWLFWVRYHSLTTTVSTNTARGQPSVTLRSLFHMMAFSLVKSEEFVDVDFEYRHTLQSPTVAKQIELRFKLQYLGDNCHVALLWGAWRLSNSPSFFLYEDASNYSN